MKRFYWLVSFTLCALIALTSAKAEGYEDGMPDLPEMSFSPPTDTVHGLIGSYYNGMTYDFFVATRIDSVIQFDWGSGSPMPGKINNDNFSVRWVGYVKAPVTGTYTFHSRSDDGARIIIGGLVILDYFGSCCRDFSGTVFLEAGELYPLVYEMQEGGGGAAANYLDWEAPGLPRELVPNKNLYAIAPPARLPAPDVSRDTIHGLVGYYYKSATTNSVDFDTLIAARIDPQIDFDWGTGSPMPGRMVVDNFAVRWEGFVRAPVTGTYTFTIWTDDGARLYINGQKIIDYWEGTCCTDYTGTIDLDGGILYSIKLEMQEGGGGAGAHYIKWQAPGLPIANIPNSDYYTIRLQTVFQPRITPTSAIYIDSVQVRIRTLTNGSDIYYTTDGSTPTEGSTLYTGPFSISEDAQVKAIASHKGMVTSLETSASYRIIPPLVSSPTFNPTQGIYGNPIQVKINTKEDSTTIYYTVDGTNPDSTSMVYENPIEVDSTTRIKSFAVKEGLTPSEVSSATFTMLPPAAAAPEFSIPGGTYDNAQQVSISSGTEGAVVHYALNDAVLNEASPVYSTPIEISKTTTLKAYAAKDGLRTSEVTMASYQIGAEEVQVAKPEFSLPEGKYNAIQQVAINTETADANIFYTTDGSDPDENSSVYFSPILVRDSIVLKAYAAKPGMTPSDIMSATYVVKELATDTGIITGDLPVPQLTLSPNPATDFVRISWSGMIYKLEGAYVTVTDSKGVLMKKAIVKGGYTYYDLRTTTFADGVYFVRVRIGPSVVYGKLIIGR